jgi:hypothetical protein
MGTMIKVTGSGTGLARWLIEGVQNRYSRNRVRTIRIS